MIRMLAASSLIAAGLVSIPALAQHDPPEIPPPVPAPLEAPAPEPVQHAQPPAPAAPTQANAVSPADRRFIEDAAHANAEEIKLGELARSHAQNDDVRKLAQKMIDDHTKANDELKVLADQKGIPMPTAPAATEQSTEARLSKLNGTAFDKEYLNEMMNEHRKDVAEFQRVAQGAKDPDVKAFAQKMLPVLQDHGKAVTELRKLEIAPTMTPPAPGAPQQQQQQQHQQHQGTMPNAPKTAPAPTPQTAPPSGK